MATDPDDTTTMSMFETENQQQPEVDLDATLAAVGLKRTTAYVKVDKKRKGSAERMARMREKKAAEGIKTKDQQIRELGTAALEDGGLEALEVGRAVLQLKGFKRWLVMRWIRY